MKWVAGGLTRNAEMAAELLVAKRKKEEKNKEVSTVG